MHAHHYSAPDNRPLNVLVVGAGGTGSAIFLALPYLHQAMQAWGHPGLSVILMDGDLVSETNCVRQPFARTDIGQNKATVLANRVNLFWGLDWKAIPHQFGNRSIGLASEIDLLIGCVDSKASRALINKASKQMRIRYWLDIGNTASHGQFVLGEPKGELPTAAELYPEIIDTTTPESDLPSCSAVEALERQMPFTNQALAMQALAMLTDLLRYGKTTYHGAFWNAKTGITQPIPVPAPAHKPRRRSQ